MSSKSTGKQRKKKTGEKIYKTASEMPKIEEMVKNTFGSEEIRESLDPKKIKEMVNKFAKENMDEIVSNLVGPDGGTIKDMLGLQSNERPNLNPERFGNRGNVGPAPGGPGRNEARIQQNPQKQRRDQMEKLAEKATTLVCTECSGHFFDTIFIVKRVSPLISPSGEEMIIPVQTFRCIECDNVNENFMPHNILNDIDTKDTKKKKKRVKKKA
jgi:hypothetical protein